MLNAGYYPAVIHSVVTGKYSSCRLDGIAEHPGATAAHLTFRRVRNYGMVMNLETSCGASMRLPDSLPEFICRLITALLVLCLGLPAALHAQTRDACLSASGRNVTTICYRALENGNRDASVYQRIVTEHFNRGEVARAKQMLGTAMSIHGETEPLVALQVIVYGDSSAPNTATERDVSEASAQQFGLLKSLCLTNDGEDGLVACRRYLQVADDTDSVVAVRLEALISIQVTQSPPTTSSVPAAGVNAELSGADAADGRGSDTASGSASVGEPAQNVAAGRAVVREIQKELNATGFEAGTADGVVGGQTRDALGRFYQATALPVRTSFDPETLSDLRLERARLKMAQELYALSREASEKGDATLAMDYLEQADQRSTLLGVPADYADKLDTLLTRLDLLIAQVRQLQIESDRRKARYSRRQQGMRDVSASVLGQP